MFLRPMASLFLLVFLCFFSQETADFQPRDRFGPIASFLDASTSTLRVVSIPPEGFPPVGNHEEGYPLEAVNATLGQVRERTLAAVPQEDTQLETYVQKRIPQSLPAEKPNWVSVQTARRVFESLRDLLNSLRNMSSYRLDLKVITNPKNARFELVPAVGSELSTSTDGTISNVFRAEYLYRVKKDGYENIQESIDLVVRSGNTLECELQKSGKNKVALPCDLK
jgi:hypothetical protein